MRLFRVLFNRNSLGFFIHLMVMMLIFLPDRQKREHFTLRFWGGLIICLIVTYKLPNYFYFDLFKPCFVLTFFLVCIFFWFCFEIPFKHAVFYGAAMFAIQNLAFHIYAMISVPAGFAEFDENLYIPINYSLSFLFCFVLYHFWFRRYKNEMDVRLRSVSFTSAVFLVLFIVFILNSLRALSNWDAAGFVIVHTLLAACCTLGLLFQFGSLERSRLEYRTELMEQILHKEQQQHELSKETIELINMKCHDLKKQIRLLRSGTNGEKEQGLREIEEAVMVYGSSVRTGCDALDILLTEKSLYCEKYKIHLACMVDGEKLSFMSTADIYSLFGNMLDNAIESVIQIEDADRRIINFNIYARDQFLIAHIENTYCGELVFEGGLPKTTKSNSDWHGFGMKSMQYIAEKYCGNLLVKAENQLFTVDVILPIQDNRDG